MRTDAVKRRVSRNAAVLASDCLAPVNVARFSILAENRARRTETSVPVREILALVRTAVQIRRTLVDIAGDAVGEETVRAWELGSATNLSNKRWVFQKMGKMGFKDEKNGVFERWVLRDRMMGFSMVQRWE